MPAIKNLGSDEQVKKWMPDILAYWLHGSYAQTELGHGSNVQGIETTAVFDKATDSFIINTPSIKAYKFWPGDLGIYCTHTCLFARLIVDGNDYGPHAFFARLWDSNHKPLKGIEIGDIGHKFAWNFKDNGYLAFKDFKIPWESLLMRHSKLDKDGKFSLAGDPAMLYIVLLDNWIGFLKSAPWTLSKALTIAIWYAIVRT